MSDSIGNNPFGVTGHEPVLSMDATSYAFGTAATPKVWVVDSAASAAKYPAQTQFAFTVVNNSSEQASTSQVQNPTVPSLVLAAPATSLPNGSGGTVPSNNSTLRQFTLPASQARGTYQIVGTYQIPNGAPTAITAVTFSIS